MDKSFKKRNAELEQRVDTFVNLRGRAEALIDEMNEVEKKKLAGGTEKQFRMLMSFLRENGIWDEQINFDIKPDSFYFEADHYLPVDELSCSDGYSLNFERSSSRARQGAVSEFIVCESNGEFISVFNEKEDIEINLGNFLSGNVEKSKIDGLENYLLEKYRESVRKGENPDKINLKFETTTEYANYGIYDYAVKVLNKVDSSYFVGEDFLKRIVGIYLLLKAQEGDVIIRGIIIKVLRKYFQGIARNAFESWSIDKFGKIIFLADNIQVLTFDEAVRRVMRKVLFGDDFRNLGHILRLSRESELISLAGEEIINKKIMSKLVKNFKNDFINYLERAGYEDRRFTVIYNYEFYKNGIFPSLKFEDLEDEIVRAYLPILSSGLSPIEAIGNFFNKKVFTKGHYFKYLIAWFKGELVNWIEHSSNPLELAELEAGKVSLEGEASFSDGDSRKLRDTIAGKDNLILDEKITKLDLFFAQKRLLKKAKTVFQKKKIEEGFKVIELSIKGYSSREIGGMMNKTKRQVNNIKKEFSSRILD